MCLLSARLKGEAALREISALEGKIRHFFPGRTFSRVLMANVVEATNFSARAQRWPPEDDAASPAAVVVVDARCIRRLTG